MVFSSISFLYVFLPAVMILHFIAPAKLKNTVLLAASLLFYYIGEQKLVLIMILSCAINFFCALAIEHFSERAALKKLILILAVLSGIAGLTYFKYADLLIKSFNILTGAAVPLLKVALPIGISFYTFQTMSYTIDVYKGDSKAQRSFIDFAAFVTLFPQLIAGPIVRYDDVANELRKRSVTLNDFGDGIRRFCLGLGKKVLIANTLSEVTKIYDAADSHTVVFAWFCAIIIPLQLYFDFSGYSDMAIGLGRMLGFHFPENFDHPFASRSASEFWRRWHMTLGSWFRDYIYIPMGGNRVGKLKNIINLLTVWMVTGLWHGAEYNFILWGLWYGILIVLEKYVYGKQLGSSRLISHAYFVIITLLGFEIFSASGASDILKRIGELFGIGTSGICDVGSIYYITSFGLITAAALVLSLPVGNKLVGKLSEKSDKLVSVILYAKDIFSIAILIVSTACLVDGTYNPFMYFRF